ncbi:MAG: hypothetical protein JW779_05165 [Candidatus Thorarchaeota archaeon]|nr:hypothetical protein [Candidatus Thorarchaeota archaeon]
MTGSILQIAFDNIAQHISNIERIRELVYEIDEEYDSIDEIIKSLEERLQDAEITLRTDIRILINECRHLKIRTADK